MRHQKSILELEKESFQKYNIWLLWLQNQNLSIISTIISHVELKQLTELAPNDSLSSVCH